MNTTNEAVDIESLINGQLAFTLSLQALAALRDLGHGLPLVTPDFSTTQVDDPVETLTQLLVFGENGQPAPWFKAVWPIIQRRRGVGLVARDYQAPEPALFYYYLRGNRFIEQVNGDDTAAFLLGGLEQLGPRVALNIGLLADREHNGVQLDPIPHVARTSQIRFRSGDGPEHIAVATNTDDGWFYNEEPVEPGELLERLGSVLRAGVTSSDKSN